MSQEYSFAVCLSHDVDRIYKTYQYAYQAIAERNPKKLLGHVSSQNPYWTFPQIMEIEQSLNVRSSFHILDEIHLSERPKSEWISKDGWMLFAGNYNINHPSVVSQLKVLDELGWEIALHGSYTSSENPERFEYEKNRIESAVDTKIIGNRQHYWRLSRPQNWEHLRDIGIKYDASLGSSSKIRFEHGYELIRPFGDDFVVFPWSLMDGALMNSGSTISEIKSNCKNVLNETKENQSVLVADWHVREFYKDEFPNSSEMYKWLIEEAIDMGAWVGSPREFYQSLPHPNGTTSDALNNLAEQKD